MKQLKRIKWIGFKHIKNENIAIEKDANNKTINYTKKSRSIKDCDFQNKIKPLNRTELPVSWTEKQLRQQKAKIKENSAKKEKNKIARISQQVDSDSQANSVDPHFFVVCVCVASSNICNGWPQVAKNERKWRDD